MSVSVPVPAYSRDSKILAKPIHAASGTDDFVVGFGTWWVVGSGR